MISFSLWFFFNFIRKCRSGWLRECLTFSCLCIALKFGWRIGRLGCFVLEVYFLIWLIVLFYTVRSNYNYVSEYFIPPADRQYSPDFHSNYYTPPNQHSNRQLRTELKESMVYPIYLVNTAIAVPHKYDWPWESSSRSKDWPDWPDWTFQIFPHSSCYPYWRCYGSFLSPSLLRLIHISFQPNDYSQLTITRSLIAAVAHPLTAWLRSSVRWSSPTRQ